MEEKDRLALLDLFEGIKKDDVEIFGKYVKSSNTRAICYGRFPLLSLLYLYRASKIIKIYEKDLLNIDTYYFFPEIYEMYSAFRKEAGRGLRLYAKGYATEKVISPYAMLAFLGEDDYLAKLSKHCQPTDAEKENIQQIYRIRHNATITFDGGKIAFKGRPMPPKKQLACLLTSGITLLFLVICILSLTLFGNFFGGGFSGKPTYLFNENQLQLASTVKGNYLLKNNISSSLVAESFEGVLDGDGNTITLNSYPFIKDFSGEIKNVTFLFEKDFEITQSGGLLFDTNNGTLDNVKIIIKSKVIDTTPEMEKNEEQTQNEDCILSGIANINKGVINNCIIEENLSLVGNGTGNIYLVGLVNENYGEINNCIITENSSLQGEDCDVIGLVMSNMQNGKITSTHRFGKLEQISNQPAWHPNVIGFVNDNYGTIDGCGSGGEILSKSTVSMSENTIETVAVGFVHTNEEPIILVEGAMQTFTPIITNCENTAIVRAVNEATITTDETKSNNITINALACGLALVNYGEISNSNNQGDIYATSTGNSFAVGCVYSNYNTISKTDSSGKVMVNAEKNGEGGGIALYNTYSETQTDFYVGAVSECNNYGDISVTTEGLGYVGGIVGVNTYQVISCKNTGNLYCKTDNDIYMGGVCGVTSYFTYFFTTYYSQTSTCGAECQIQVDSTATDSLRLIGGIVGYCQGKVMNCFSALDMILTSTDKSYVGGIIGLAQYGSTTCDNNYYLKTEILKTGLGALYYGNTFNPIEDINSGSNSCATLEELKATEVYR